MKALEQNYRKGTLRVVDLPAPKAAPGRIVVRTHASLASVGTEKSMIELAKKSLIGKARARPDLVRQVIAKARTDGIMEAWRQAMGRLETPMLLGYSSAGIVVDVGHGVRGFAIGDRVSCAGSGYAGHVEVTSVPPNLCTLIPDGVSFDQASFVAIGGIALEALRMARISLGERVVVIGLGLVGQIAVQLLRAAGCHVFGIDFDAERTALAAGYGATTPAEGATPTAIERHVSEWSHGIGADAAIILAATSSNQPLEQAATLCRERGRIVATGMVGLEVPRRTFYDKELELVVSRAWGPGLYDSRYTDGGVDYPAGYARWTANRNMQEFLAQLASGAVNVEPLITHRFAIERAVEAYELVMQGKERFMGVVLTHGAAEPRAAHPTNENEPCEAPAAPGGGSTAPDRNVATIWLNADADAGPAAGTGIGLIGAGQFAKGTMLPAIKQLKATRMRGVASSTGLSGHSVGERYGFDYCTTDTGQILGDPGVDLVIVLTRHDSHAAFVSAALRAGKHVFVEKPLALDEQGLQDVASAASGADGLLMVGFNRRFSPAAVWLKERLGEPDADTVVHFTVNAGLVPAGSWIFDPRQGGGRVIGEMCHFVDLAQYLTGALPAEVHGSSLVAGSYQPSDNVAVTMRMDNGALVSITYVANGDRRYPRERVEVFSRGRVGTVENFTHATFTENGRQKKSRSSGADRGHKGELAALIDAIAKGGLQPVPTADYVATTLATFAIEESLRTGLPVGVSVDRFLGTERR